MDGNDINNLGSVNDNTSKSTAVAKSPSTEQKSTQSTDRASEDLAVTIEVADSDKLQSYSIRQRANDLINIVNVTSGATEEIENLLKSISGIVEQAQDLEIPDSRRSTLQKEANQLVKEIKTKAQTTEANGLRPLLGESVRFDIEQKYGYALDIILPDTAKDAFGLGQINFSMKDSIIDTLTRVEKAKNDFIQLRESVSSAAATVKQTVDTIEVGLQNAESSKASVRSVDEAFALATSTHNDISRNTSQALGSFNKLRATSLSLLES